MTTLPQSLGPIVRTATLGETHLELRLHEHSYVWIESASGRHTGVSGLTIGDAIKNLQSIFGARVLDVRIGIGA